MRFATAVVSATDLSSPKNSEAEPTPSPRRPANQSARDRLIADHFPFVRCIAGAVGASPTGRGVPLDDLVAYGAHGLLQAAERFDSSKGVPFEAFARHRIRGAVIDGIRGHHWLSRRTYNRVRAEQLLAFNKPANDVGPRPSISRTAPLDPRRPISLDARNHRGLPASLELGESATGDRWNGRLMAHYPVEPDDGIQLRVKEALARLPDKERRILELCYFGDMTFEQVGAELGIQRSWVCRLHARALNTLRVELGDLAGAPVA
jgi:RNA polymerase sigma factor (sigma-70 family)